LPLPIPAFTRSQRPGCRPCSRKNKRKKKKGGERWQAPSGAARFLWGVGMVKICTSIHPINQGKKREGGRKKIEPSCLINFSSFRSSIESGKKTGGAIGKGERGGGGKGKVVGVLSFLSSF